MKKKKIIGISVISIAILSTLILVFFITKCFNSHYERNAFSVIIEIEKNANEKDSIVTFDVKDDGKNALVNSSLFTSPIYVTEKGTFFEKNGRFKNIESQYSYRDIYKIISEIEVSKEDGNYHPVMTEKAINNLLKSLFIDYEHNRESVCNVTIVDGSVEDFSLYLKNFHGYSKVGIIVTKEEISSDYVVKTPVFYDKVTDEIEEKELRFLK